MGKRRSAVAGTSKAMYPPHNRCAWQGPPSATMNNDSQRKSSYVLRVKNGARARMDIVFIMHGLNWCRSTMLFFGLGPIRGPHAGPWRWMWNIEWRSPVASGFQVVVVVLRWAVHRHLNVWERKTNTESWEGWEASASKQWRCLHWASSRVTLGS